LSEILTTPQRENVIALRSIHKRREDNIKMKLRKVGGGMDWINLAQDRDRWRSLVIAVMNLWVP
jgi:phage-related protein